MKKKIKKINNIKNQFPNKNLEIIIKNKMKTRIQFVGLAMVISLFISEVKAQSLVVSAELKELIELSLDKDRTIIDKDLDMQITRVQQKAVRSAYIPKLELGGKYLYAYSKLNSEIGDIAGFESVSQLQEFMKSPTFLAMFPNLAGLASEINQLGQLMAQQGMSMPSISKDVNGSFYGNYFGLDATAKMLLYSGGQVPNTSKALTAKLQAQEALTDKSRSDVICETITCYDQLALLIQSKILLDESATRLAAEKKFASLSLENGFATSFDTLRIAVASSKLNAKLSEYESKKALLHHKLAQLSGKPESSFISLAPELDLLLYSDTVNDISNRAELRALSSGVEAQKFMLKASKSHYLPKVQAMASVRYDEVFNANADMRSPLPMDLEINQMGLGPTFMVGAGFKWDIFDRSGGSTSVKKAKLEVEKAENAREEARELLQLNQTKVIRTYQASNSQVVYKEQQRKAARMALSIAQKSYSEGVINITERLAIETEVQNAELEYLQAVFAQRQAVLECYKATGNLTLANIL